jgi:XTP/dITP diphosphohydrolase
MDLVFATHNSNKLKEVELLLPEYINLISLNEIGCIEEIPETAETLEGNALLKVNYVAEHYGYSCFADDTGLLVDFLDGAPGVHSARYAGDQKSATDNMNKLLSALRNTKERSALFQTVIALHLNGKNHLFHGRVSGEITLEKHGMEGFGYDPIFKPEGYDLTFAELPIELKNKISHRAKALEQLIDFLNKKVF